MNNTISWRNYARMDGSLQGHSTVTQISSGLAGQRTHLFPAPQETPVLEAWKWPWWEYIPQKTAENTHGCSLPASPQLPPQQLTIYQHLPLFVAQSCPTFWVPMDGGPPGSSVHGILQVRILEWIIISFSRGSSWPRDRTRVSRIVGIFFTVWATGKSHLSAHQCLNA